MSFRTRGVAHIGALAVLVAVGVIAIASSSLIASTDGSVLSYASRGKRPPKTPRPTATPVPTVTPSPLPSPTINPSPSATPNSNIEELRVIEVRYFPKGENDVIYHPNTLSTQLRGLLASASAFHGYKNAQAVPAVNVNVVKVYNRYTARPNVDGNWGTTYKLILEEDNLCQQIHDLDIDQIWLWVDPRAGYDPGPGVEYAISSNRFQHGVQYATVATPAFCNGQDSFVMMGFDFTRTADLAFHSFGHMLEGMLGNLQTIELFWYRFGGNTQAGYPLSERCGNVHYPPNGTIDYDYANSTTVQTYCEDWNPEGTGVKTAYNCTRWGCNQQGYLTWWMQNMPNKNNNLFYQGKRLPNWWDFTVDLDETIAYYKNNTEYFMNTAFLNLNP